MYKKVKLAGIISTLILSASAYSAEMTVGFSQIGSESGWRAAETSVAKSEAQKRGITLKIADAQQKQENQIKAIRSFIAQGVDAIFIAPVVQTGWDPVLQEAKEAEIPVFLLDRNITVKDDALFMTGVAADSVHEGAVAAQWLIKQQDGRFMHHCTRNGNSLALPTGERFATLTNQHIETTRVISYHLLQTGKLCCL